jgi:hypothetical protein
MSEVVVIEFSAPGAANIYTEVNSILGWDGTPDPSQMPVGMISHVAGELGDKLIVLEVWQSKGAQEEFMQSQLGPALAKVNAPQPTRIEWFKTIGDVHRH